MAIVVPAVIDAVSDAVVRGPVTKDVASSLAVAFEADDVDCFAGGVHWDSADVGDGVVDGSVVPAKVLFVDADASEDTGTEDCILALSNVVPVAPVDPGTTWPLVLKLEV